MERWVVTMLLAASAWWGPVARMRMFLRLMRWKLRLRYAGAWCEGRPIQSWASYRDEQETVVVHRIGRLARERRLEQGEG